MRGNESRLPRPKLRLLVRMGTGFLNYLRLEVHSTDTVRSVEQVIERRLGIHIFDQELYYEGKKLFLESTLKECSITYNDAELKLVDLRQLRDIARNPKHKEAWDNLHSFMFLLDIIHRERKDDDSINLLKEVFTDYLESMPLDDNDKAKNYIKIFTTSAALQGLISLSKSKIQHHELCTQDLISIFLGCIKKLHPDLRCLTVPILLEFCLNFSKSWHEYHLNTACRSSLGEMMVHMSLSKDKTTTTDISLQDLNAILSNIVKVIGINLTDDEVFYPLQTDVMDLKNFMLPLKKLTPQGLASQEDMEINNLRGTLSDLVTDMGICLNNMELLVESIHVGCYQHIVVLYDLQCVSHLFQSIEEELWAMLRSRKIMFSDLIINHSRRSDNNDWISQHKEITNFECRRHVALLLFPELNNTVELTLMEIERLNVFEQSFTRIINAETHTLQAGLPLKFKDEEATGPGVVREWFALICQVLFDPQRDFFIASPNDRRRFFPKSVSKVNPEYYKFAGRVIALALMHKVHIGIILDRVFCLQLAERSISLEDIRDLDPMVYKSCLDILNMDSESLDRDALMLTFTVDEEDESGSKRVVDLVHGGVNIAVDSKNKEKYVDIFIHHWFIKSVAKQVDQFTNGFNDIIGSSEKRKLFFQYLQPEDLGKMLNGSER